MVKNKLIVRVLAMIALVAFLAVSLITILPTSVGAESAQSKLKSAQTKQSELKSKINSTQSQINDNTKKKEAIDSEISKVQTQIDTLNSKIADSNSKIAAKQTELTAAEEESKEQYDNYLNRAKMMVERGSVTYLEVLLNSKSFSDLLARYSVVKQIVRYDSQKLDELNRDILTLLQYDMERFRMDLSTHPFTETMGLNDVRITTRYEGTDFKKSISSTIHEAGHALYNLQCDQSLSVTPLEGGSSLALHESQSRFWENIVGRSLPFVQLITPLIRKQVSFANQATDDELYLYFNNVKPDYIRVDADEVTYNLHIAIRYEIEKKIFGDELNVSEIPEFWNDRMEQLLGVRPTQDSQGVLQDTHWSSGLFGYFPTYTLGNLVSAIIASKMRKDLNEYKEENIRSGDLKPIREWLRLKIHQHGSVYAPKVLLNNTFNEGYNPDYFVTYIETKYLGS